MKPIKLLLLCPHPEGVAPGQRLKYEQYFEYWRAAGIALTISPFMSLRFWKIAYRRGHILEKIFWTLAGYFIRIRDLFRMPRYDVVYVFLWGTPFGAPFYEWLVNKVAHHVIYDIDDLVYTGKSSPANRWVAFLKGRNKPFYLMKHADHVITCTPYLDRLTQQFNEHTSDISSTINTHKYIPVNPYRDEAILTIGWSGSITTSPYLHLLQEVLLSLYKEQTFHLLVIGDESFTIPGLIIEARPWREAEEVAQLQRIDIGLYPLPDEEWVLGKSGLKALQYMALGIPTLATAVGANFRVIEDGVSGYLVNTPEEWLSRLRLLANNPQLRRQIGLAARARIESYFSLDVTAPVYVDIIQSVANGKQPSLKPPTAGLLKWA